VKKDASALRADAAVRALPGRAYRGADLRGADLRGLELACFSLRGACLEGADLSGARLHLVDLSAADLRGANLEKTVFQGVDLSGARAASAFAREASWLRVTGGGTDLRAADLRTVMWSGCGFERARLDGARLEEAQLLHSTFTDTSLRGARLTWANTVGSSFAGADFGEAQGFFLCREVIVEIARRAIENDFERACFIGAIAVGGRWCYAEWKAALESRPHLVELARSIFSAYPQSGLLEALESGWRATPGSATRRPPVASLAI
jgi:uncharacterized protein YjbI with pentapeptide repeats